MGRCIAAALCALSVGCLAEYQDDGASIDEMEGGVTTENALTTNALTKNALIKNALTKNALTRNALAQNGVLANGVTTATVKDPSILDSLCSATDGAMSREFFRYMISCALTSSQQTKVVCGGSTWIYRGSLGVAPNWFSHAPSTADQERTSACIASRVNALGVSVSISLHGNGIDQGSTEPTDYTKQEGAFWGNLFSSPSKMWSCRGERYDSHRAEGRSCTYADCGLIEATLQSCHDHDNNPLTATTCGRCVGDGASTFGVYDCAAPGGPIYYYPITVYLK